MALDFNNLLSPDQKRQILEQRIQAWAQDAYSHELNKQAIQATDPSASTDEQDKALETLETAITLAQEQLAAVEAPPVPE
jgi:hypothetical protein